MQGLFQELDIIYWLLEYFSRSTNDLFIQLLYFLLLYLFLELVVDDLTFSSLDLLYCSFSDGGSVFCSEFKCIHE
jgi:hypothetical protein